MSKKEGKKDVIDVVNDAKLKPLRDDIKALKSRVTAIERRQTTMADDVADAMSVVELLEMKDVAGHATKIKERVEYLAKRLQLEILRQCVVTEISRVYPDLMPATLRAIDEDDDWWKKGDKYTIAQWARRLKEAKKLNS